MSNLCLAHTPVRVFRLEVPMGVDLVVPQVEGPGKVVSDLGRPDAAVVQQQLEEEAGKEE